MDSPVLDGVPRLRGGRVVHTFYKMTMQLSDVKEMG